MSAMAASSAPGGALRLATLEDKSCPKYVVCRDADSASGRERGVASLACFVGAVAHSASFSELDTLERGMILVEESSGVIVATFEVPEAVEGEQNLRDFANEKMENRTFWTDVDIDIEDVHDVSLVGGLFIPGFVDGHAHAPQYAFTGTGNDLPLLKWLETYTFPVEAKFSDPAVARDVYSKAVDRHLRNGTTTCSYFATIHLEATKILVDVVRARGQRAHVGLVNMDRNSPSYYIQTTKQSLSDTQQFVEYVNREVSDPRITAVITPRFVPSCSSELMHGLGKIAKECAAPVQSHLSETVNEVAWVKSLHPEASCYADVYRRHGLLLHGSGSGARSGEDAPAQPEHSDAPPLVQGRHKAYMAHCCQSGPLERSILHDSSVGVIHCPNSNFSIGSGVLDVRKMMADGVAVGLGTDVAGGYSCSILDAMRQARIASQVIIFQKSSHSATADQDSKDPDAQPESSFTVAELMYLATVGGAKAMGLEGEIGTFAPGKQFDALAIVAGSADVELSSPVLTHAFHDFADVCAADHVTKRIEKFVFLGDDRHIQRVYVSGRRVV